MVDLLWLRVEITVVVSSRIKAKDTVVNRCLSLWGVGLSFRCECGRRRVYVYTAKEERQEKTNRKRASLSILTLKVLTARPCLFTILFFCFCFDLLLSFF